MKNRRIIKYASLAMAVSSLVAMSSGCAQVVYNDGVYTGKSAVYENEDGSTEGNGYGVVTLTIEGRAITACEFVTYEPDGTLKDEEYGKQNGEIANRDYYNKAQKAVAAASEYAAQLVEKGSIDMVDAISGATLNYNQFTDAVLDALDQAR